MTDTKDREPLAVTATSQTRPDPPGQPRQGLTFVLVHGAFQTGAAWEYVAAELRRRGHAVHTPTIAGHGPDAPKNLTHADAVASLVAYLREHDLSDVVLVGHSIAGTFIAKAAEQVPELIKRLVFHSAFAAADGSALVDEFPPEQAFFFDEVDPAQGGFLLPFEVWRELACNDIDLATANAIYAGMSPIPVAYLTDKLDLKVFYELIGTRKIKTSYVNPINDIALGANTAWFPRFAQRLGPLCRILQLHGGHEVKNTRPSELANTLIQAGRD
jgi:pimeloyl-ACP methyl ester carboxylesterase